MFVEEAAEKTGGALSGLVEVDVGIGVIDDDGIRVLEDAIGENAVEVERDDDGGVVADDAPGGLDEVAVRIVDVLGSESAVQGEVDAIEGHSHWDAGEEFAGDTGEVGGGDGTRGGDAAGTVAACYYEVIALVEDLKRASDLGANRAVVAQDSVAKVGEEVIVVGKDGVERGDFLLAFVDEDSTHWIAL